jgi:GWxTD domain-containing protein
MSPLLLVVAIGLSGEGSEKLNPVLEATTFLASESTLRIELSYEIPYTSLAFLRDSAGFVARFSLRIQCWDSRRSLVLARDWDEQVREANYDSTMRAGAVTSGVKVATAPRGKLSSDIVFQDLQSERTQSWSVPITPPRYMSDLRLQRLTEREPAPTRGYTAKDSLAVSLEIYQEAEDTVGARSHLRQGVPVKAESCFVRVVKDHRTWLAERRPLRGDSWRSSQQFRFALRDLENGRYEVVAELVAGGREIRDARRAAFEVVNSFFNSEHDYRERVGELLWIATESEMQALRRAAPVERESLWNVFWQSKDHTPTTQENETERTYFERIEYAEKHFGHGDRGYRSDRARVYVRLGPPDQMESLPFERESNASEIWYYYDADLRFVFSDVSGFGEFKLIEPKDYFSR